MTKICQINNENSCQIENKDVPLVYNGFENVTFNNNDASLFKNTPSARQEMQRGDHKEYLREVRKFYNFIECPLDYKFTHDASTRVNDTGDGSKTIGHGYKSLLNQSTLVLLKFSS